MTKVHTKNGLIDLDQLTVKDFISMESNARVVATEWYHKGEMVRRDVAVSLLQGQEVFGEQQQL